MVEILEQPDIRRMVAPISVELYRRLSEFGPDTQPTELIHGIIIDKADKMSRSQLHVYLVRALFELVQLATKDLECFAIKEDPVTLADSEPEPDVTVVQGQQEDYRFTPVTTALLVIEVAVTSLALDREKASLYAGADIPEYWIVLAERQQIEVYTLPVGGFYTQRRTYQRDETLPCTALPALRVELSTLFAQASV